MGGIKKTGNLKLSARQIEQFISNHRAGKVSPNAKLSDGDGMYLTITKAGTAVWRMKYRHAGKELTYSIGPYGSEPPAITLAAARTEREHARAHLRQGRDPSQARRLQKASNVEASGNTFETVARDWLSKRKAQWSKVHFEKSQRALERDVFKTIGALPVADIRPVVISSVIEKIANRGAVDTASKVLQHIGGVFRLAQARGLCESNPADPVRAVLPKRSAQKRRPAYLKWSLLGDVLREAEKARLSPAVRLAHRLCAFTAVRISNVVTAEWKEFDLEASPPLWVIPRAKMKAKDRTHDHKVVLGPTIASELAAWQRLTGRRGYVFPSPAGGKHITRESLEKAYRVTLKLEDKHTPHGWRSALSTLARDEGGFERDVVELALDHVHDNDVVRAYDRGERLQDRVRLMMWWDEQLSRTVRGADVLELKAHAA
jgi:integrase